MLGLNSPKNVSSGRRSDVGRDSVSFYGVEMLEPKILLSAAPIDAAPEDGGLSPLDAVDSTALEEVRFADVVECEASSETFMPSDVETSLLADGEEFAWDTEPADSSEDTTAASEETVTLTVSTDLDDYAPGATAIITADGLDDGASVTLEVDHVSGPGDDGVYGTADDEVVQLGGDGHEPWTVTDGSEADLDGLANGTVVTEWYVNPDDSYKETFLLSASEINAGADGIIGTADDEVVSSATATFTDQLIVDFKQAANNNGEPDGLGDIDWIGSIVQESNSVYFENMSLLQRVVLTGFTDAGGDKKITLDFSHEATKAGIHAFDWLTSYSQAIEAAVDAGIPYVNTQTDPNDNPSLFDDGLNLTPEEFTDGSLGPPNTLQADVLEAVSPGGDGLVLYIDVDRSR